MNTNKINVELVGNSASVIEDQVLHLQQMITNLNSIIDSFSAAWNSDSATVIKNYVNEINLDLGLMKTSIDKVQNSIKGFATGTSNVDNTGIL